MKDETKQLISALEAKRHPYFPVDGIIDPSFEEPGERAHDMTEMLFNSSYLKFCFDPAVTAAADLKTMSAINELSSGNNDLGYFRYLFESICQSLGRSNYFLSNYSGGRGDYFTVCRLLEIENELHHLITGELGSYELNNLAVTLGGQGAYSALANYFAKHVDAPVLFFDSTYCSNFRPFTRAGVAVEFAPTPQRSLIPDADELVKILRRQRYAAMFLVKFHNPSGEVYSDDALRRILLELKRQGTYLIYSEAYETIDFRRLAGDESRQYALLRLCKEVGFDRLIRVRTVSKDRGFAGLRAGYMLAPSEIIKFTIKYNDEVCFNPPLISNPILVTSTYFQYRSLGGACLPAIEEWLGIPMLDRFFELFERDDRAQMNELFANMQAVCRCLGTPEITQSQLGTYLEGSAIDVVVPEGGINMFVRLKALEQFDQIDVFRKLYLDTGLIMHSAQFMCKRSEYWIRITLSHKKEKILAGLEVLMRLLHDPSAYTLLPRGSLRVGTRAGLSVAAARPVPVAQNTMPGSTSSASAWAA